MPDSLVKYLTQVKVKLTTIEFNLNNVLVEQHHQGELPLEISSLYKFNVLVFYCLCLEIIIGVGNKDNYFHYYTDLQD